jgi:hypothetical protein
LNVTAGKVFFVLRDLDSDFGAFGIFEVVDLVDFPDSAALAAMGEG